MNRDRRELLLSSIALVAANLAPTEAVAQETSARYGAANTGLGITSGFAKFLSGMRYEALSPKAVHEAKRAVLDWTGVALAGSTHPTAGILLSTFDDIGSAPSVTIIGHGGKKLSLLDAPVVKIGRAHV